MCFSIKRTHEENNLNVIIKGELIEQVEKEKYLGVIIDSQLNFKNHVKNLTSKIKASINCFRMIRDCLSFESACVFVNAIILSQLYCTTVWTQTNLTTLKPLERLYNRAYNILDKKSIRFYHCLILAKLKVLNFINFCNLNYVKLVFKCLNGLAPEPLSGFVTRLSMRATRATSHGDCRVPFCKTSFAQTVFSVKGANLWNSLPAHIKTITGLSTFKKQTKSWFIQQQQCDHV